MPINAHFSDILLFLANETVKMVKKVRYLIFSRKLTNIKQKINKFSYDGNNFSANIKTTKNATTKINFIIIIMIKKICLTKTTTRSIFHTD